MTIYIFDMDGTLTPPRLPMTPEFEEQFFPWLNTHSAFVATGSDFSKVEEQLSNRVIEVFSGIYCVMGNQLRRGRDIVYQKNFVLSNDLRNDLEYFRKHSSYNGPFFDNYIEERVGMINFSVLGRNCSYSEREKYHVWDNQHHERLSIQTFLSMKYPDLAISIGGTISLDITPKGCGKGQIAHHIRAIFPSEHIVFIGDKTLPGGNDYELAFELTKFTGTETVQVAGPSEVLSALRIRN